MLLEHPLANLATRSRSEAEVVKLLWKSGINGRLHAGRLSPDLAWPSTWISKKNKKSDNKIIKWDKLSLASASNWDVYVISVGKWVINLGHFEHVFPCILFLFHYCDCLWKGRVEVSHSCLAKVCSCSIIHLPCSMKEVTLYNCLKHVRYIACYVRVFFLESWV